MSILVTVLRAASLLAFAGPILLIVGGRDRKRSRGADRRRGDRTPVVANFAAFGLFFAFLAAFAGNAEGLAALVLALCGCLLALAGAALVLWSRAELGSAWSLVPTADQGTGLVTTGPYRLIRHPIYLGLSTAGDGRGPRLQQLACRRGCIFRDCADLCVARACGGKTAS